MNQRTPKDALGSMFQYSAKTIFATSPSGDIYELDCDALNAIIRRGWSAYDKGWKYGIGKNIDPSLEAQFVEVSESGNTDCSGFIWYSNFRKRLGTLWPDNSYFKEIRDIIPGCALRYNAQPGKEFGHAILVVNVLQGGRLETLDMSRDSGYSGIFYRGPSGKFCSSEKISEKTADDSWLSPKVGGIHAVISTDAIIAVNGVKYKHKSTNLLLLTAKQPVLSVALASGFMIALIAFAASIVKLNRQGKLK